MKGVCVKSTPPALHDTSVPPWLQPRTKPRSRGRLPNMLSCGSFTKGFSPGGSPPDKNATRQMFVKLGLCLRPPMTSCALWKRNSRSTLNSTVWPRDPRVYLKVARDSVTIRPAIPRAHQSNDITGSWIRVCVKTPKVHFLSFEPVPCRKLVLRHGWKHRADVQMLRVGKLKVKLGSCNR